MNTFAIDLSRYYIGKGREEQVELLSDDDLSDFYSQKDYEELDKIGKRIRNLCKIYRLSLIKNNFKIKKIIFNIF